MFDFFWFDVAYQTTICGYFMFWDLCFWYETQSIGPSWHSGTYTVGNTPKLVGK